MNATFKNLMKGKRRRGIQGLHRIINRIIILSHPIIQSYSENKTTFTLKTSFIKYSPESNKTCRLPSPTKTGAFLAISWSFEPDLAAGLDTGPPKDGEQSQDTAHFQWWHTRQCANPEACIQLAGSLFSERAACLVCERVFGVSEIDLIRAAD